MVNCMNIEEVREAMERVMKQINFPIEEKRKSKLVKPSKFDIAEVASKMLWHNREPYAKSTDIARYFGMRHDNLIRKIEEFYSFDEMFGSSKLRSQIRTNRGKEYKIYEMDSDAFAFICLSMTGRKAEKFKWAFIEAFKVSTKEALKNKMRVELNKELEPFLLMREEGKSVRLDFTNTMKRLCEYAEEERGSSYGSKCPFYPMYTKLIYKTLGLQTPTAGKYNIRDLSAKNVKAIEDMEADVAEAVNTMIDNAEEYHEIYKWIKSNIDILFLEVA